MLKSHPMNGNSMRSIALIIEALFKLMAEKPFKNIAISEITKTAGVVRNTFYAHFACKEDVLSYEMLKILEAGYQTLDENHFTAIDLVRTYFETWDKNKGFLERLSAHDLLGLLHEFEHHIDVLDLRMRIFQHCSVSESAQGYANSVYGDVLASILKRWIRTGMNESATELTQIFGELICYTH